MKRLFILLFCFATILLKAQHFVLSGRVVDGRTKAPIEGANLLIESLNQGTTTNKTGTFNFNLKQGKYQVTASFIGYTPVTKSINLRSNQVVEFILYSTTENLREAEVTAPKHIEQVTQTGSVQLSAKEITTIPTLLGEPDVLKSIQLLPGVQGGTEGTSGFYVRGGSPDQNLILMDGVPVYNASHLFGFFSTFNADMIEDVELLKSGFPARYGGRLSSVLNVNLKQGNMQEYHGSVSLGLIAPKLLIEGPIIKDKTSFIISGRRSIYDLVVVPFLEESQQLFYHFGDVNTKLKHIISEKDEISLSYFHSADKFRYHYEDEQSGYEEKSGINWKNHTVSTNWSHKFKSGLSTDLLLSYNNYQFNTHSEQSWPIEFTRINYKSLIEDVSARYDLNYKIDHKHTLRVGTGYSYHTFRPGAVQYYEEFFQDKIENQQDLSNVIYSNEITAYAEDTWNIGSQWQVNGGLHYAIYDVETSKYTSLQPRLSTQYFLNDGWILFGSYAEMTQFLHLLSNTGLGVPTDLWVSATDKVKPQQSQQYAIGSTKYFKQKTWELTTEVFYKTMQNLIEYKEGASYLTLTDWQNVVETDGTAEAYGLEVLLRKSKGKTTGWIAYTLASTTRTFSNLNDGKTFPYRYDRRHDLSIVLNHRFNEKIDVSANWVYQSGIAFTGPQGRVSSYGYGGSNLPIPGGGYEDISDRNALRYPAYHRLDLAINFTKQKREEPESGA